MKQRERTKETEVRVYQFFNCRFFSEVGIYYGRAEWH